MNIEYSVDNFRVFKDNAPSMHFAPITILTGCNSSGKSSIVKSMLLLRNFMKDLSESEFRPMNTPMDFSSEELMLGRFDKVLNRECRKKDGEEHNIVYHYSVYSKMLEKFIKVDYVFSAEDSDDLNNGWLREIKLSCGDDLILEAKVEENDVRLVFMNFKFIKDSFIRFAFVNAFCSYRDACCYTHEQKQVDVDIFERLDNLLEKFIPEADDIMDIKEIPYVGKMKLIKYLSHIEDYLYLFEYETIIPLRCFEHLKGMTKEETLNELRLEIQLHKEKNGGVEYIRYMESIIDAFNNSKEDSLLNFYLTFENSDGINRHAGPSEDSNSILFDTQFYFGPVCYWSKVLQEDLDKGIISYKGVTFCLLDYSTRFDDKLNKELSELRNTWVVYSGDMYGDYDNFIKGFLEDVFSPKVFENLMNVGSSRVDVKRLYAADDKDRMSGILKSYFRLNKAHVERNRSKNSYERYEPGDFMNKWIKELGVGNRLSLKKTEDGYGIAIRLHTENDEKGHLICDEGYGITQLVSLLLNLENAIMEQMLDLGFSEDYRRTITVAIEEPEVHLHPRYQSLLADMFMELYKKYGVHVIIESHSEYMIRKFQTLIASGKEDQKDSLQTDDLSIYYMYDADEKKRPSDKKDTQLERILVGKDGRLQNPFGSGFFDEADNLSMDLLM